VKKHFDEKNGVLFKCDPVQVFGQTTTTNGEPNLNWLGNDSTLYYDSYILKSDKGWAELLQLINTLNNNTTKIDSILNVDRVLWAFAVNSVIANLDTYNGFYIHNYYLYQTKDGLFQMIPWDLSESFGGALLGGVWSTPNDIYHFDPFYGYTTDATTNPLLYKLLYNPQYYLQYTAHLRTIIDESLDTAFIRNSITELQNLGYAAANADVNKPFTIAEYHDNVESALWSWSWFYGFAGILSTIDERKPYLLGHPEIMKIPPSIMNVMVNNNLLTAEVFNGTSVDLMATISEYNSKFQEFEMNDSGQNGDSLAGDNIYTAQRLEALLDSGRYVMVDFTADWCLTCKTLEQAVLKTDTVQTALHERGVVQMVADWTKLDTVIGKQIETEIVKLKTGKQLPIIAFYFPNDRENPRTLVAAYTTAGVLEILKDIPVAGDIARNASTAVGSDQVGDDNADSVYSAQR
jgi:thiol-disulfide isomerase/thioredoxin